MTRMDWKPQTNMKPPRWEPTSDNPIEWGPWLILEYVGRNAGANDQNNAHHYRIKCRRCGTEYVRAQHRIKNAGKACKSCSGRAVAESKRLKSPSNKWMSDEEATALMRRVWK